MCSNFWRHFENITLQLAFEHDSVYIEVNKQTGTSEMDPEHR
jgi:hypothetical protein